MYYNQQFCLEGTSAAKKLINVIYCKRAIKSASREICCSVELLSNKASQSMGFSYWYFFCKSMYLHMKVFDLIKSMPIIPPSYWSDLSRAKCAYLGRRTVPGSHTGYECLVLLVVGQLKARFCRILCSFPDTLWKTHRLQCRSCSPHLVWTWSCSQSSRQSPFESLELVQTKALVKSDFCNFRSHER